MKPNSIWETLSRRLSRFGDAGPLRRALERVGLVKREPSEFAQQYRGATFDMLPNWTLLHGLVMFGTPKPLTRWQRIKVRLGWMEPPPPPKPAPAYVRSVRVKRPSGLGSERSKQIPAVWQAADRAERGGK